MVIAPLSANTLSEIVSGGCRSLLTSVVRAWDATGQVDGLVQLPDVWVRPISRSSVAAISSPPTSRTFPATYASTTAAPPGGSRRPAIRKRIVVAPAMNTAMWEHPVTAQQIAILERDWGVIPDDRSDDKTDVPVSAALDHTHDPNAGGWFEVLRPQANKRLACGDVGAGAMAKWEDIVRVVLKRLGVWTLATAPK